MTSIPVTRSQAEQKSVVLTIQTQDAGLIRSKRTASNIGGELLRIDHMRSLPKDTMYELKEAVRHMRQAWFGDKLNLKKREAELLASELTRLFGEKVHVRTGNGQLGIGFDTGTKMGEGFAIFVIHGPGPHRLPSIILQHVPTQKIP